MSNAPATVDVRAPRFGAWITSVLLLVTIFLSLVPVGVSASGDFAYVADYRPTFTAAFWALVVVAALFLWGVLSPRTAPWGVIFRRVVAPRLGPVTDVEDARPPRFAQGVGLAVAAAGIVLHLIGVPGALTVAASAAFVAAFLNAAFGVCLGCMMYLGLQRLRTSRPA